MTDRRMRTPGKILTLLVGGWWLAASFSGLLAQETAAPVPPVRPEPTPAAPEPPPYSLDLPDVHPPGNGNNLFPNNPRQNPPSATTPNRTNKTRRNPLDRGSKRRGRSLDRTLQQADADPLAVRVAYRRDKTVALARDPELAVLLRQADAADTDVKKRAFLREYYTRLFASIRRLDSSPGMTQHVSLLAQVAAQRYDPQRRVVANEEDLLNTREGAGNQRLGR